MASSAAREKMRKAGASARAISVFERYQKQLEEGATGLVPEDSIDPLAEDEVPSVAEVEVSEAAAREAIGKTVVLKLNGGLGTSMGMEIAKSLLPVRGGLSFLEIIQRQLLAARQRYEAKIPLILMNSFRTREDSLAAIDDSVRVDGVPIDFLQGKEPKLRVDNFEPVEWPQNPELEWCPPGHGDIFTTLTDSGLVKQLLDQGYRYLATSNADNLGAYPSARLAGWFAASGAPYAPEVCVRTAADRKGGHLARRKRDGRVILRDTAQTPAEDMHYFTDEFRHRYFHTNNLWFNLEALDELLERTDGILDLPLIRNRKTVDPRDAESTQVYQIECAIGAVVEKFDGAAPVLVPRSRFLPVKTTNDLLTVRSDAYRLTEDYRLELLTQAAPIVDLDPKFFKKINDFEARFQQLPSLRDVEHFTVRGDWSFAGDLTFTGDVELSGSGQVRGESF